MPARSRALVKAERICPHAAWRPVCSGSSSPRRAHARPSGAPYVFIGFLTDGLALRALALVHAPDAVPAIEKALKRAREQ
jgi:hypothetical protein